jgi:hypothetical protein
MNLGDLRKGTLGITPDFGGSLCEAASVCLEHCAHGTGVEMAVTGSALEGKAVSLTWPGTTDQMRRCYADLQFATEFGSYGIAILVIEEMTDNTVCERSRKGTGFDYWVAPKVSASPLFQDKRRLEVSGLLEGDEADLKYRVKQKLAQMKRGGVPLHGYGLIVHFGRPETRVEAAAS